MKFFSSSFKKQKSKSKDATKLFDEVLGQVAPQLEESVNTLIVNERKQLVKKAIENMQHQLNNITNDQPSYKQVEQPQQVHTIKSTQFVSGNQMSQNADILQNVIQQLIPYVEESVKTMITNEKDLLIGTIVQHIQSNLNEKNQIKSE
jgi:hypothetical protein